MTLRTATEATGRFRMADGYSTGFVVSGCYNIQFSNGALYGYFAVRLNDASRRDDNANGRSTAAETCCSGFPCDGTVEEVKHHSNGRHSYRYTEGPKDKAFMEQKDREYLTVLKDSDDPERKALFVEEIASLDLSLKHHRNLKQEFDQFIDPEEMDSLIPRMTWLPESLNPEMDSTCDAGMGRDYHLSLSASGIRRYRPERLVGAILTAAEFAGCYSEMMPSLSDDAFKETYIGSRLNVSKASPELMRELWQQVRENFPCDGLVEYIGEAEGYHCFRYHEGPKDRIFMQSLDSTYVASLAGTESFERIIANLDLTQTHHQTIYRQSTIEPAPTYEAAGGGGSGGAGKASDQLPSLVDDNERGLIDCYDSRLGARLKTGTWGLWLSATDELESERVASGVAYSKNLYDRSCYLRSYLGQRLNAKPPTGGAQEAEWVRIVDAFPADGRIEQVGKQGDFYEYRYEEGPKDKAFMEEQDARYLEQLAESDDQEDKVLLLTLVDQLDLTLTYHQKLQEIYRKTQPTAKLKTATKGQRDTTRLRPPHRLTEPAVVAGCRFFGSTEADDFTVILADTYMGLRLNIKAVCQPTPDQQWHAIVEGFPADGWCVPTDSDANHFHYFEGTRDKLYMERQDKRYMRELADSDNPADKATLAQLIANLDDSRHHRALKRLFQPRPGRATEESVRAVAEEDVSPLIRLSDMEEAMQSFRARFESRIAELETSLTSLRERRQADHQRTESFHDEVQRLRGLREEDGRVIARQADELQRLRGALQRYETGGVGASLSRLFCRRPSPAAQDADAAPPTSPPTSPRSG